MSAGARPRTEGASDPDRIARDSLLEIETQLRLVTGDATRVAAACARLVSAFEASDGSVERALEERALRGLVRLVGMRAGAAADCLVDFLVARLRSRPDLVELVPDLLFARAPDRRRASLDLLAEHAAAGSPPPPAVLARIAVRLETDHDLGLDPGALRSLGSAFAPHTPLDVFLEAGLPVSRRLAARVLDAIDPRSALERAPRVLGTTAAEALAPHLAFAQATHADLLHVAAAIDSGAFESWREAKTALGPARFDAIVAGLGWARVREGLAVDRRVGVSVDDSPTFLVPPEVGERLLSLEGARATGDRTLVVAHGGVDGGLGEEVGGDRESDVHRFRRYNVAHAELLGDLLEITPLDAERLERIVSRLDTIVEDHVALFAGQAEDASRLPETWRRLRPAVAERPPAVVERPVLGFEDPSGLDDVTTLHGLKRYLHQSGLRLAFRRFRASGIANRTVDLVVLAGDRPPRFVPTLRYLDFEPDETVGPARLPFPVALAVEELARHVLDDVERLPDIEMLCYGNEVQVYVGYRNHPAFLRLDLSPPLRGGMVDLEYYGVSRYELDRHPDPSLPAIRRFLRRLEFDVADDDGRLHVRYDKERTVDFEDVQEKARLAFRCIPLLMDLDWTIGSLDYGAAARDAIADAWADHLLRWGTLPVERLLTRDRRRVLAGLAADPAGAREIAWEGIGPYRDRTTGRPDATFAARAGSALARHGGPGPFRLDEEHGAVTGQIGLERAVSGPWRDAIEADGITGGPEGGEREREHEAQRLARTLAAEGEELAAAVRLAAAVGGLERHLRFRTTGSIEGHPVQRATLALRGRRVTICGIRDREGILRAAVATAAPGLWRQRSGPSAPWLAVPGVDAGTLVRWARASNYPVAEGAADAVDTAGLAELFRSPNPRAPERHLPGDRVVGGTVASPGRAAGFVRFDTASATAADFRDAVFVGPVLRPEDGPLLRDAAAIVSSGGGVLSHAGLIALESGLPALVVNGRCVTRPDGSAALVYHRVAFREIEERCAGYRILRREDERTCEEFLVEGDLVVVDADVGSLIVLGQDPETVGLHRELKQWEAAHADLAGRERAPDAPALRGRLLRALHQLEKLLGRIARPALARHAVSELLACRGGAADDPGRTGPRGLLAALFANPTCGEAAREAARRLLEELDRRHEGATRDAAHAIGSAGNLFEVLWVRSDLARQRRKIAGVRALLDEPPSPGMRGNAETVERLATARLDALAGDLRRRILAASGTDPSAVRPLLVAHDRHERLRRAGCGGDGTPIGSDPAVAARRSALADADARLLATLADRRVVGPRDGDRALAPLVGGKAAGLAEIERVLGPDVVPPWFAITRRAIGELLDGPVGAAAARVGLALPADAPLHAAVDEILARPGATPEARADAIRRLWQAAEVPPRLSDEITGAYRRLGVAAIDEDPGRPFIAIRSSGREEDSEQAAWAGQFDTILFVRGERAVLEHVKLALAGYWTPRAIARRDVGSASAFRPAGGLLVQRMVAARASGVVHTACASTGCIREMIIDVGLGLGEGVVSGIVEVDHVLVAKDVDPFASPLRFRYRIGDKREQIVFDRRVGLGTRREPTLYHQRFRAALEYPDLVELVRAATRLERALAHPLDLEFAFEGPVLRVLQARPLGAFHARLEEALARHPEVLP